MILIEKTPHHARHAVWQQNRTIEMYELHLGDSAASEKAKWLLEAVAIGGCACWITNTVKRAQRIFEELQKASSSGIDLQLLHAQFPLNERQHREDDLKNKYGRNGKHPARGIVVGTQVLEQSLDLDFDVMVSDLAPIDLTLQRAGRLHRHDRVRRLGLVSPGVLLYGEPASVERPRPEPVGRGRQIVFESDREAVDRFTFDLRWKYAAGGLEYDYPGFVHTVLVDMRARLARSAHTWPRSEAGNTDWAEIGLRLPNSFTS